MTISTTAPGTLRIGCAGWSIPTLSAGAFPAEGSHLERYATVLDMVEINSTFYRPHQPKTYARWADSVSNDFRFSVKLPRSITHDAKLIDTEALVRQFASEAGALGDKLGCLLVQLPPKLGFDAVIAERFFQTLKASFGCTLACEARHPGWFGGDATTLLTRHGITRVIADPAKGQPGDHVPTSATIYARLHGSPRIYYSPYSMDYVAQLGRDMATHVRAGRDVWIVFDNTLSPTFMDETLAARRVALGALGAPRPG